MCVMWWWIHALLDTPLTQTHQRATRPVVGTLVHYVVQILTAVRLVTVTVDRRGVQEI